MVRTINTNKQFFFLSTNHGIHLPQSLNYKLYRFRRIPDRVNKHILLLLHRAGLLYPPLVYNKAFQYSYSFVIGYQNGDGSNLLLEAVSKYDVNTGLTRACDVCTQLRAVICFACSRWGCLNSGLYSGLCCKHFLACKESCDFSLAVKS